jgi:hypothetical protein
MFPLLLLSTHVLTNYVCVPRDVSDVPSLYSGVRGILISDGSLINVCITAVSPAFAIVRIGGVRRSSGWPPWWRHVALCLMASCVQLVRFLQVVLN